MAPIDLNLARAFVAVRDRGSFSLAAEDLGVPRSTVSRAIASLEAELDVRLFHRTTRKVAVTTAGAGLYERVAPSLLALEASFADLPEREEAPSGVLRVASTIDLGSSVLAEASARFTARYPGTQVDLYLDNRFVDLAKEGFDLALRIATKRLGDSSLYAKRVGGIALQLYASPSYLARRGVPKDLADLEGHDAVIFRTAAPILDAKRKKVTLRPRVICDDTYCLRELTRQGAGVGSLPSFLGDADVANGLLVRVIPRFRQQLGGVYVVHPGRKHLPAKVTAFRDLLLEMLRQRPLLIED
jgi:DNA-binding transcriptional LysR family regulator